MYLWLSIWVLGAASLACSLTEPTAGPVRVALTRLPTLTPTMMMTRAAVIAAEPTQAGPNSEGIADATDGARADSDLPVQKTAAIAVASIPAAGQPLTATQPGNDVAINSAAGSLPSATPSPSATATLPPPTQTPTATATPTPALTPTPLPEWLFVGVNAYPDPYGDGQVLYGEVTNNSGTAQELFLITGSFFDSEGSMVAAEDQTYAYWPGYVIPAGGRMPFELTVEGVSSLTRFDLRVEAEPSAEAPRQDIEFLDVQPQMDGEFYCLQGRLRNPGGALQDYLIVAATVYDAQDNVVGFGDYEEFGRASLVGDKTSSFEVCVETDGQAAARHVLQAWAR